MKSFQIKTPNDFTIAEAKNRTYFGCLKWAATQANSSSSEKYVIGLGGAKAGSSTSGPSATFMPEPNVDYQIEPTNVFYLTFGNFSPVSLIDADKIGSLCVIDYGILNDDGVVVHDDHGNLVVQNQ